MNAPKKKTTEKPMGKSTGKKGGTLLSRLRHDATKSGEKRHWLPNRVQLIVGE